MSNLIYTATLIVCLAAGAGALLIVRQLISSFESTFHRQYFYYLAAFYSAAVYGIGAQLLARSLLDAITVDLALVERIAGFVAMLGVPFLFVSWLMLINMAYSMFQREIRQVWMAVHAFVFVLLIAGGYVFVVWFRARTEFYRSQSTVLDRRRAYRARAHVLCGVFHAGEEFREGGGITAQTVT